MFARPHATPGPSMRDFEAYYAAGAAARAGGDAYGKALWTYEKTLDGVDASRYEILPFVGPPPSLLLWKSIAAIPYGIAVHAWQIVLGLCALIVAFLCARLCRLRLSPLTALMVLAVFLAFGPMTSDLALGQIALPALAAVLIAVAISNRSALPAAVAGALAFVQPNIGITIAGLTRHKRGRLIAVLAVLLFLELFALTGGIEGIFSYVQVLQQHGAAERFSAIQITPAAIAYGFGVGSAAAQLIGGFIALAATAAWFLGMRSIDSQSQRFAFTCALAPLSMPFFHEHDLVIVVFPAMLMALRCSGPLALAGFFTCSVDWLGLAQRPDGTVQTVLLAASGLFALIAIRGYTRKQLVAPLAIIALAALFGALAAAHPLPVWPDGMRGFPVTPEMSVAQIWEAEQRATGLLSPNAFAALLRVLPLLGCALLSAQLYRIRSKDLADSRRPYAVPAASL